MFSQQDDVSRLNSKSAEAQGEVLYLGLVITSRARWGFPCGSAGKESACNVGDLGSIPRLGRSSREGNSYPLQYSGLENSMDYIVHGVARSRTRLSNFHFTSQVGLPCVLATYRFFHRRFHLVDLMVNKNKLSSRKKIN